MVCRFWKPDGAYGEFSNYYPRSIKVQNLDWKTSEHLYQAQKFLPDHPTYACRIFMARTPHMAKYLANMKMLHQYPWQAPLNEEIRVAQAQGVSVRPDWDRVKDQLMCDIVLLKFRQHEDLRQLLLSTGDETIVEASPYDSYWGIGSDGKGSNKLGRILMEVRKHFRSN